MVDQHKLTATDLLTDKAKWTASCLRPHLEDKSDDAFSRLFHTLREHYAMAATEVLMEAIGRVYGKDDELEATEKELEELRKWKLDQIHLDDRLNRGNKHRIIKTDRGAYYDR